MRTAILVAALLGVSACAEPIEDREPADTEPLAPATNVPAITPRVALVPGVIDDNLRRERNLMGELGCVFRRGQETLFAAVANSANIESAEGLVVIDGQPIEVEMDGSGGYNSLQSAASFTGDNGIEVEIAVSEEAEIRETPAPATGPAPMEATMTLSRDGQQVSVEGRYECGPQADA
ncbi:hypothetical protein [Qipengyuania sp. NPDC077563]|uniref:hypothetical protein n=1 Tax=Qipengyuania sp. NPDC077563 TaxID=3364497 RepID=UPI00384C415B